MEMEMETMTMTETIMAMETTMKTQLIKQPPNPAMLSILVV